MLFSVGEPINQGFFWTGSMTFDEARQAWTFFLWVKPKLISWIYCERLTH